MKKNVLNLKNLFLALLAALLVVAALGTTLAEEIPEATEATQNEVQDEVFFAVCEPLFFEAPQQEAVEEAVEEVIEEIPAPVQTSKAPAAKATPKESPKFYTEESAIRWAQEHGLDDFQVEKTYSTTLNVGTTVFTNREEAQDYLTNLQNQIIAANGGVATIANGYIVTDGFEVSLSVYEQHSDAYTVHPLTAKLPVLETGCTEYVPASVKKNLTQTVADRVGVDAKTVKQHNYLQDGVSYTRFTYDKNGEHFIAEYVRDTALTKDGETQVVYRPLKVVSKTGSVYTNPDRDKIIGYAVYDLSYLPLFQTVTK